MESDLLEPLGIVLLPVCDALDQLVALVVALVVDTIVLLDLEVESTSEFSSLSRRRFSLGTAHLVGPAE
jgi:hypothetical protein